MITLLSPSKGQDFDSPIPPAGHSLPKLLDHSQLLITELRQYSEQQLQALMDISPNLARLNVERYRSFSLPFSPGNSRQALFAFTGDVYSSIDVQSYGPDDLLFAQDHLRIVSGLYGCLRPLDLIQPYRLEMKTKLATERGKDLYSFWGQRITAAINEALADQGNKAVINLASNEYFKAVDKKTLTGPLVDVVFQEVKNSKARVVAIYAKRARGMMADFILRNRLDQPEDLQRFQVGGYRFAASDSTPTRYVFVRPQPS